MSKENKVRKKRDEVKEKVRKKEREKEEKNMKSSLELIIKTQR